jgi:hypothetical protein
MITVSVGGPAPRYGTVRMTFLRAAAEAASVGQAIKEIRRAFKLLRWKESGLAQELGAQPVKVGRPEGPTSVDPVEEGLVAIAMDHCGLRPVEVLRDLGIAKPTSPDFRRIKHRRGLGQQHIKTGRLPPEVAHLLTLSVDELCKRIRLELRALAAARGQPRKAK